MEVDKQVAAEVLNMDYGDFCFVSLNFQSFGPL